MYYCIFLLNKRIETPNSYAIPQKSRNKGNKMTNNCKKMVLNELNTANLRGIFRTMPPLTQPLNKVR